MVFESNIDERITGHPASQGYFNLFGKQDEGGLREMEYQQALAKYPTPKTCDTLAATIDGIKNEIKSAEQRKVATIATGGSGRVEARFIDGYTRRKDELVNLYNQWLCAKYEKEQQHQQYLSDFTEGLSTVKKITSTDDKTGMYVVFAMLGVVVIGSAYLMLK